MTTTYGPRHDHVARFLELIADATPDDWRRFAQRTEDGFLADTQILGSAIFPKAPAAVISWIDSAVLANFASGQTPREAGLSSRHVMYTSTALQQATFAVAYPDQCSPAKHAVLADQVAALGIDYLALVPPEHSP